MTKIKKSWRAFFLSAGAFSAIAAFNIALFITESRIWRDLTWQTPFRNVIVDAVQIEGDTLYVWGSLRKVRCKREGVIAYVKDAQGNLWLADFSSDENLSGPTLDRPVSSDQQRFGAWSIRSPIQAPKTVQLYAYHICPEGRTSNLVFELPWADRS